MKIEIMGTGCPKCRKVESMIEEVIRKTGASAEVVHVTDLNEIVGRGVMMTPAVFVDGVKKAEGRIPGEADIKKWLGV